MNSWLSAHFCDWSVSLYVCIYYWNPFSIFFSEILHSNRNFKKEKKVIKLGFQENLLFALKWQKGFKLGTKMEGFFTFHNFFSLHFSGSNLKHCTFLFSCTNHIIWKNSGSQVILQKCSCPIRLQDFLSIGISGSNVSIPLILCIEIFKER